MASQAWNESRPKEKPTVCTYCGRVVGAKAGAPWNREATPGIQGRRTWRLSRHKTSPTGRWCPLGGIEVEGENSSATR
jgi:hypothetical protein